MNAILGFILALCVALLFFCYIRRTATDGWQRRAMVFLIRWFTGALLDDIINGFLESGGYHRQRYPQRKPFAPIIERSPDDYIGGEVPNA